MTPQQALEAILHENTMNPDTHSEGMELIAGGLEMCIVKCQENKTDPKPYRVLADYLGLSLFLNPKDI